MNVAAQVLDSSSPFTSIKEITLMCSGDEDCTLHLKHGDRIDRPDDFKTFRLPVKKAKQFLRYGEIDYKNLNKYLLKAGYDPRTRRCLAQNFHGMFENCCTTFRSTSEAVYRIEKFVNMCKRNYDVRYVIFVCNNSFILRSFARLVGSFATLEKGFLMCCINSIPPLIKRSEGYDFKRCVYHMTFPQNYLNSFCDRDPCSRAVLREVYSSNFDKLINQISLFFDRCETKYLPKKDFNLCVTPGVNKTIYLITELSPEVLQNMFDDIMNTKSVSIDVKNDLLRNLINK